MGDLIQMPTPPRPWPRDVEERFLAKIDVNGPIPAHRPELGPCWVWTASTNAKGYGTFAFQRKSKRSIPRLAHRLAWALAHGQPPSYLCVLHHCDNPPCCNPSHLFLGTRADNNEDMEQKGRGATAETRRNARSPTVVCVNGHDFTGQNVATYPNGRHRCRVCHRIREQQRRRSNGR